MLQTLVENGRIVCIDAWKCDGLASGMLVLVVQGQLEQSLPTWRIGPTAADLP